MKVKLEIIIRDKDVDGNIIYGGNILDRIFRFLNDEWNIKEYNYTIIKEKK